MPKARARPAAAPPDVFAYTDFRAFLRDVYAYEKGGSRHFSLAVFARRAGVSRAYLKKVMDYGWRLSDEGARKFARGLRLNACDAEYLLRLVRFNQAKEEPERETAQAELKRWIWEHRYRKLTVEETATLYGQWRNGLVVALTKLPDFRANPAWISRRLGGRISPDQARSALAVLARMELIRMKGRRMVWRSKAGLVATFARGTPAVPAISAWVRTQAAGRLRTGRGAGKFIDRYFALSREEYEALKERMDEWGKGVVPRLRKLPAKAELYALVTDLLPLSEPVAGGR